MQDESTIIITSDDVCCNIRNVKFIKGMQFKQMFVTAVCVLFLLKLKWPKSKNFYETNKSFLRTLKDKMKHEQRPIVQFRNRYDR